MGLLISCDWPTCSHTDFAFHEDHPLKGWKSGYRNSTPGLGIVPALVFKCRRLWLGSCTTRYSLRSKAARLPGQAREHDPSRHSSTALMLRRRCITLLPRRDAGPTHELPFLPGLWDGLQELMGTPGGQAPGAEPLRTPEVLEGDLRIPARREKYHTHHPRLRVESARERERVMSSTLFSLLQHSFAGACTTQSR